MNLDYDPSHVPNRLPSSKSRNHNIPSPYHSNGGDNPYHSIPTEGSPEKDILYEYRKVQLANKIDDSLNDLYASLKASQNQLFQNYEHGRYNNSVNFDGVYNPFEKARNIGLGNGWSYRVKSYKGIKGPSPIPKFENLRYLSPSKRNGEPGDIVRTEHSSSGYYTNRVQNYIENQLGINAERGDSIDVLQRGSIPIGFSRNEIRPRHNIGIRMSADLESNGRRSGAKFFQNKGNTPDVHSSLILNTERKDHFTPYPGIRIVKNNMHQSRYDKFRASYGAAENESPSREEYEHGCHGFSQERLSHREMSLQEKKERQREELKIALEEQMQEKRRKIAAAQEKKKLSELQEELRVQKEREELERRRRFIIKDQSSILSVKSGSRAKVVRTPDKRIHSGKILESIVKNKLKQNTDATRQTTLNDENKSLDLKSETQEKITPVPPEDIKKSIHELNIHLANLKSQILTQSQIIRNNATFSGDTVYAFGDYKRNPQEELLKTSHILKQKLNQQEFENQLHVNERANLLRAPIVVGIPQDSFATSSLNQDQNQSQMTVSFNPNNSSQMNNSEIENSESLANNSHFEYVSSKIKPVKVELKPAIVISEARDVLEDDSQAEKSSELESDNQLVRAGKNQRKPYSMIRSKESEKEFERIQGARYEDILENLKEIQEEIRSQRFDVYDYNRDKTISRGEYYTHKKSMNKSAVFPNAEVFPRRKKKNSFFKNKPNEVKEDL